MATTKRSIKRPGPSPEIAMAERSLKINSYKSKQQNVVESENVILI
jgi:hypothetical protein